MTDSMDIEVGALAQNMIRSHVQTLFSRSSTGSAKHLSTRLIEEDIPAIFQDGELTLNPWKVNATSLKGRKHPFIRADSKNGKTLITGVFVSSEGVTLDCNGINIEDKAYPSVIFVKLLAGIQDLDEKGVFTAEEKTPITKIIDINVPGYDPPATGYKLENIFGGEKIVIETAQNTIKWQDFKAEMISFIDNKVGHAYD